MEAILCGISLISRMIDLWCNGSTPDFDSGIRGSNPRWSTKLKKFAKSKTIRIFVVPNVLNKVHETYSNRYLAEFLRLFQSLVQCVWRRKGAPLLLLYTLTNFCFSLCQTQPKVRHRYKVPSSPPYSLRNWLLHPSDTSLTAGLFSLNMPRYGTCHHLVCSARPRGCTLRPRIIVGRTPKESRTICKSDF